MALTAMLLPLAAVVALMRRSTGSIATFTALVVGTGAQGLVVLHTTSVNAQYPSSLGDLPPIFAVRVLGSALVGDHEIGRLWESFGDHVAPAFAVTAVLVGLALVIGSGVRSRRFAAVAGACSLAFLVVPIWLRGTLPNRVAGAAFNPNGTRYAVVPVLLVIAAAAVPADDRSRRAAGALVAAQVAAVIALGFSVSNGRSAGPSWSSSLDAAREQCAGQPAQTAPVAVIPPGFVLWLDCADMGR